MAVGDFKVHVHLGHGFDADKQRQMYERGEAFDLTHYEFHLTERPGVSVSFSSDGERPPAGWPMRRINRLLRFPIDHAWHNRKAIAASDAVWTMSENEAFAVAALMMFGIVPRRPLIGTAIWLFDEWFDFPAANRALFRHLSRWISVMTVHSRGCLPVAARAGLKTPVEFFAFGINERTYRRRPRRPTTPGEPIRVLAAGNDPRRDWPTLLAALGNDDRFVIMAWTRALGPGDQARVANLRLPKPASGQAMLDMWDEADVVVVPLVANIFSGITVALEGAAIGKPVIASRTGGIPSYFSEDEVRYVPPGDADALRAAVLAARDHGLDAMADRARERFEAGDYSTRAMIDRYLALTLALPRPAMPPHSEA